MRNLKTNEIEAVVKSTQYGKASVLLYKTARVDTAILNETFGEFGWQCSYSENKGNLFCTISVKNPETGEWVSKSDCGSESNIAAEKGEASDAFKRAGFKWGIGTELYTTPKIQIPIEQGDMYNDKFCMTFTVAAIGISDDHRITSLTIKDRTGRVRYQYGSNENAQGFDFQKRENQSIDFQSKSPEKFHMAEKFHIAAASQTKGHYQPMSNGMFTAKCTQAKQFCITDDQLLKLKRFYEFWLSADKEQPSKSKLECMKFFNFEQRLEDWMNR